MNRAKIFLWCFLVILIIFFIAPSQEALSQESAEQLYEAALFKKEAEGDLEGAIQLFQKIIAQYPENRKMSAKAQLQIGKCLEKLGLKEASTAYQKVIDNYPGQEEEVREARENLSLLIRAKTVLEKRDIEFKIRKFSAPDVDIYGPPSLDGRYLSYVDWTTGNLAVLEIATGKTRHLTDDATWEDPSEFALSSTTSPNSTLVAYSWCPMTDSLPTTFQLKKTLATTISTFFPQMETAKLHWSSILPTTSCLAGHPGGSRSYS
jgi:hypothetical protein